MIQKSFPEKTSSPGGFENDIRARIQTSPEVRDQVVDDVSRRIASGSYYIPIDRIVEKLLSHDAGDRI
jgi:hypothetical protein